MHLPQWYVEQASRYIKVCWSGTATFHEINEEAILQRQAEYRLVNERIRGTTALKIPKILTHADLHKDKPSPMTVVKVLDHDDIIKANPQEQRVSAMCADHDAESRESQNIKFGVNRFVTKRPRVLQR